MNKKAKKPKFEYPFKDAQHEDAAKRFVIRNSTISDRNSRVEMTQVEYAGGWRKFELKETLYFKKNEGKTLGELLSLRPYDQMRMKKLLDFVASMDKSGKMFLARKGYAHKPLAFTSDQWALIRLFYEHRGIKLDDAVRILGTYKNVDSLRQTIIKINRRIIGWFKLSRKDEFIKGTFHKNRSGYSFNPSVRLEFIDDRLIVD